MVPQLGVGGCTPRQKTERRFADDGAGHPERRLHHDGRHRRRHDVAKQHARTRRAQRTRGLHVVELAGTEHLPANEARIPDPADDREGEEHIAKARSEHRDQRNREQQP
jgi:hypothetical protein